MTALTGIFRNESVKMVIVTLIYVAFNQLSIALAFPITSSMGVWFPAGFALGAMLLLGIRIWPAIAIGSLISTMLLFLHYELVFNLESVITITLISTVSTLEALFATLLINRIVKRKSTFKKATNVFVFVLVTISISFIGASVVALGMVTSNIITPDFFAIYLFRYGLSNIVGIFLLTPLIISWSQQFKLNVSKRILVESILFILALSLVLSSITVDAIANTAEKSLPFLVMPFIFWLAFRANRPLITVLVLLLAITTLFVTARNLGPFTLQTENESILILEVFLSIISITALVINATVQERSTAQKELKKFNDKLESRVIERTKELKEEINNRKATEEKIKVSNKKLRKANTELDNFVYSVSHDLRSPIASVLGLVNLAQKERSVKSVRKYLGMVANSAKQQDAFIKDILDLSRNSRLEVMSNDINLGEIAESIFEQYQYIDQNIKINKEITVEQEVPFQSDKSRIKVILNNLISNAIRHSQSKSVNINATIKVDETIASIIVEDSGVGIPKEHLGNIYKMFYRGTDATAGSGLGLYIVKETIEKLRGVINIKSAENEGTTVSVEIPNLYDKALAG